MPNQLFPEVEKFIEQAGLLNKLKGNQAQLYRILGQGQTKSKELDMPPAEIERKMELVTFKPLQEETVPLAVKVEVESVRRSLDNDLAVLKKDEFQKRLANQVLRGLEGIKTGIKDNRFYAGRLILSVNKFGKEWNWSLTPHYPIVSTLPPDPHYIITAYHEAEKILSEIIQPPDVFEKRLDLAWTLACHFSPGDKILIVDVARMYKIAGQNEKFWAAPKRTSFVDLVDAAFIANLINWLKQSEEKRYSFASATLHQAHGRNSKAFFLPANAEGTQTRPVIYIAKK